MVQTINIDFDGLGNLIDTCLKSIALSINEGKPKKRYIAIPLSELDKCGVSIDGLTALGFEINEMHYTIPDIYMLNTDCFESKVVDDKHKTVTVSLSDKIQDKITFFQSVKNAQMM